MNILIADTDAKVVESLRSAAEKLCPGAVCVGVSDPSGIMPLFERRRFDVVFIEAELPGESGARIAEKMLGKAPMTNVIYLAGSAGCAAECIGTYASGFLIKPVTAGMLRGALEHLRHPVSNITDEIIEREYAGKAVIGRKINKWREERGLSRRELADALNVELRTVYRWENAERSPDIATYMKILQVLGKSMELT